MNKVLLYCFYLINICAFSQVGIGTITPTNSLEINSSEQGNSGLRFTRLNASSAKIADVGNVLSVNVSGDVMVCDTPTQGVIGQTAYDDTFNSNTPTNTTIDVGEFTVRYSSTAFNNDLQFRSSTSSALNIGVNAHEEYNSGTNIQNNNNNPYTLASNVGPFTTIWSGALLTGELLSYHIIVQSTGSLYRITASAGTINIVMVAEKLR